MPTLLRTASEQPDTDEVKAQMPHTLVTLGAKFPIASARLDVAQQVLPGGCRSAGHRRSGSAPAPPSSPSLAAGRPVRAIPRPGHDRLSHPGVFLPPFLVTAGAAVLFFGAVVYGSRRGSAQPCTSLVS